MSQQDLSDLRQALGLVSTTRDGNRHSFELKRRFKVKDEVLKVEPLARVEGVEGSRYGCFIAGSRVLRAGSHGAALAAWRRLGLAVLRREERKNAPGDSPNGC